jgi:hypothetical protein
MLYIWTVLINRERRHRKSCCDPPSRMLDQFRRCISDKHYSLRTECVYVYLARMFIRFHGLRHPTEMGAPEIHAFLSYLANERNVSVSTHHQALCALLFLYKNVLQIALPWLDSLDRPVKPVRKPTVLTRQELELVFAQMEGIYLLIARLLYGTGMRLMECAQLRVKVSIFSAGRSRFCKAKAARTGSPYFFCHWCNRCVNRLPLPRHNMKRIACTVATVSCCPVRSNAPIRRPVLNGAGPRPSRQTMYRLIRGAASSDDLYAQGIQRAIKRAVLAAMLTKPASTPTRCAIVLQPTCSKLGTISGQYRSCSAMRMSRRT